MLVQASSDYLCALPVWQLVKLAVYSSCMLLNIDFFSLLIIIMKPLLSEAKRFLAKLVFVLLDIVQT